MPAVATCAKIFAPAAKAQAKAGSFLLHRRNSSCITFTFSDRYIIRIKDTLVTPKILNNALLIIMAANQSIPQSISHGKLTHILHSVMKLKLLNSKNI